MANQRWTDDGKNIEYEPIAGGPEDTRVMEAAEHNVGRRRRKETKKDKDRGRESPSAPQMFGQYSVMSATKLLVVPMFLLIAVTVVVVATLPFFGFILVEVSFATILGVTMLGSTVGATMVWKFGTFTEYIAKLKRQNQFYAENIEQLRDTRRQLRSEASEVEFQVSKLTSTAGELDQELLQFEQLAKDLELICGQNTELHDKVTELHNIITDVTAAVKLNERAQLLVIYYDLCVEVTNGKLGITRKEYDKLMGRLSYKTRKQLLDLGGFDATDLDHNDEIDVEEFQFLINRMLEIEDDPQMSTLNRLKQLNY